LAKSATDLAIMSTRVKSIKLFSVYGDDPQFFAAGDVGRGLETSDFILSFPVRNRYDIYLI
jgi:hypothetical protein